MDRKKLLRFVGTVDVPATSGRFVAREKFVIGVGSDAPILIAEFNDNFTEWFLAGSGKIEESNASQILHYAEPLEGYTDGRDIVNEIGGEEQAETTLTALHLLMARQSRCENGVLLNNGSASFFFIRDQSGQLRRVVMYGDRYRVGTPVGWWVYAHPVDGKSNWGTGNRYFYKKP
jgi:hypothetical protein